MSAETETIRNERADVKARVSKLETNSAIPAADGKTVCSLEERVIAGRINSVEKHLRKNNIIISALSCEEANSAFIVEKSLATRFKIRNSIDHVTILNSAMGKLKVVMKDQSSKNIVMKNKKVLKTPFT